MGALVTFPSSFFESEADVVTADPAFPPSQVTEVLDVSALLVKYFLILERAVHYRERQDAIDLVEDLVSELAAWLCLEAKQPFPRVNQNVHYGLFWRALEKSRGNVARAAQTLGMTPEEFQYQLDRYPMLLRAIKTG